MKDILQFIYILYYFTSESEAIVDYQASMETQSEDQDLVKSKHLMQFQGLSQLPQYADLSEKQQAQQQEVERDETSAKEAPKPVSLMSQKGKVATPPSLEYQQQVPFLKLLSECGEKLGIKNQSPKSTPDTFPPQDLQPETRLAFRE